MADDINTTQTSFGPALINGLGGDAGFGENVLARNDDSSTAEIDVSSVFEDGLNFFGREFDSLWVNNNGSVTFNGARSTYTPDVITENNDNPEITPFFADVDTRGGETTASPGGNSTGSNNVYYDFDEVNDRFIVTWDDVGYFSSQTDLTNAFQLIISDEGGGNFDFEFRYENIDWTTGGASGGVGGLGGTVARAGWTASTGDPAAYFELPESGDQEGILNLDQSVGNTGLVGRWEFSVRSGDIVSADLPALPDNTLSGWTSGDPHLLTLDGVAYDYHAAGEYVLLRATDGSDFEVQSRMTPIGNSVSVNSAIAARMDGSNVMVDSTDDVPLSIDGVATQVEDFGFVEVGNDRVYREGDTYTMLFAGEDDTVNAGDSRIAVTVRDGRVDLDVQLNTDRAGALEGLLGNADGNAENDIALADGTPLARPLNYSDLYGQYRDDWRVSAAADSLFTYDDGESLEGFYDADYPGSITTLADFSEAEVDAAIAAVTAAGLTPGTVNFNNAVLDFALTQDASYITSAENAEIVSETAAPEVVVETGVRLVGTDGPDTLVGTEYGDTLRGLDGNDRLTGNAGNDLLEGGDGSDVIDGGAGNDTIIGGDTEDDRSDVIFGGAGDDLIYGGYGNDIINGGTGNDTIAGGFGSDEIYGQGGDDQINGGALSDLIYGGDGDDFINGGFGHDRVNGGDGADQFFHLGIADHGSDWIQDYDAAEGDVLVFGNTNATANQFQVNFIETENAGDAGVEEGFVIYRPTGQIMWALVDAGEQESIDLRIGGETFDLLA